MSAAKLTALNTFRASEGKSPIARWHVRYTDQLAAYEAAANTSVSSHTLTLTEVVGPAKAAKLRKQIAAAKAAAAPIVEHVAAELAGRTLPVAADAMRPVNEALGQDIKAARAAWKASGATMTKKECVIELMLDVGGCSIKDIVDALGVTTTAARSLVGDVRRMKGYMVTFADGKYTVALPPVESEEEEGEGGE